MLGLIIGAATIGYLLYSVDKLRKRVRALEREVEGSHRALTNAYNSILRIEQSLIQAQTKGQSTGTPPQVGAEVWTPQQYQEYIKRGGK